MPSGPPPAGGGPGSIHGARMDYRFQFGLVWRNFDQLLQGAWVTLPGRLGRWRDG